MKSNLTTLSIVVPAYNECDSLRQLVRDVCQAMQGWSGVWRIVCVDDGSKDATWHTIEALSREYSMLQGLRFTRNFGKEAAILAGLEASQADWVVVMDADGQHPPSIAAANVGAGRR